MNIQGLVNNFEELETIAEGNNFEIIILSETHATEDIDNEELCISNYDLLRCDSESRHTGGVAIYIKINCQYKIEQLYSSPGEIWWLVVRISFGNKTFLICAVYKSPRASNRLFCDKMEELVTELSEENVDFLLAGDININWLAVNDTYRREMERLVQENGAKQIVDFPTRITETSSTLIDYLITNSRIVAVKSVPTLNISDHETLLIEMAIPAQRLEEFKTINFFRYDAERFYERIGESNISHLEEIADVNEISSEFERELRRVVSEFVSTKRIRANENKWFNQHLYNLRDSKIIARQRAKFTNERVNWNKYKKVRNKFKACITRANSEYIQRKVESCSNQKDMWKTIKQLVLKQETSQIRNISVNGVLMEDEMEMASTLNSYFINSVIDINSTVPQSVFNNLIDPSENRFRFEQIELRDFEQLVKEIKQKKDFEFVSPKMITDCFEILGKTLCKIINLSLETGKFPESWKQSMVTPIAKIKNAIKCEDFRPVNALPVCEKLLEKVVSKQLEEYFEKNNLLIEQQSGFRQKHSCETALNMVIASWKEEMAARRRIVCVFLDFKRAFETIDREILLVKLESYGVKDRELRWFREFLSNRTQRTKVGKSVSDALRIDLGVPQGSVLGTLLFSIYINDINKVLVNCKVAVFADDTLLYIARDDVGDAETLIQQDLQRLSEWLNANKLKLNVGKTKSILINGDRNRRLGLQIEGEAIEQVEEFKYLGILLDSKLKFTAHINYISKKIAKKVGFLRRIRRSVSTYTVITIYNTIVKPHFEYCSTVLFMGNEQMFQQLQRQQNKAMRTILKCNRYTPIRTMLQALKWLSVKQRVIMNVLLFIFKIKNNAVPQYLLCYINYIRDIQPYTLRNAGDFRLPNFLSASTQNSLIFKGFRLYNELPRTLKNERNVNSFKKKIVTYVKENF